MSIIEGVIGLIAGLIHKIIPDPKARDAAKPELLKLQNSKDLDILRNQLSAILAEAQSANSWTSRDRPSIMYVMYIMQLWAIPMGLIAEIKLGCCRQYSSRYECLSDRIARATLCAFWNELSWIYGSSPMCISRGTEK